MGHFDRVSVPRRARGGVHAVHRAGAFVLLPDLAPSRRRRLREGGPLRTNRAQAVQVRLLLGVAKSCKILPKSTRSLHSSCLSHARHALPLSDLRSPRSSRPSHQTSPQKRPQRPPAITRNVPVRRESRVFVPGDAGGDDVQLRRLRFGRRRPRLWAFFVRVQAPARRGPHELGGVPPRVLNIAQGVWTRKR